MKVIQDKVGGAKNFSFSAPTLLVGRQEVHLTCKIMGVGLLAVTS